jgi:hypothetical protein
MPESLDPSKFSVSSDHPIRGLLATVKQAIQHLNGSWQFQIFNNLDELRYSLEGKLSEADLQKFVENMETLVKKPLRRQMGRIRLIDRTIGEFFRYLS